MHRLHRNSRGSYVHNLYTQHNVYCIQQNIHGKTFITVFVGFLALLRKFSRVCFACWWCLLIILAFSYSLSTKLSQQKVFVLVTAKFLLRIYGTIISKYSYTGVCTMGQVDRPKMQCEYSYISGNMLHSCKEKIPHNILNVKVAVCSKQTCL